MPLNAQSVREFIHAGINNGRKMIVVWESGDGQLVFSPSENSTPDFLNKASAGLQKAVEATITHMQKNGLGVAVIKK
jgi:hypothetical protein